MGTGRNMSDMDYDGYEGYNGDEVDEVEEVEEMVDDVPMFIASRVYLGSIDAAANASALRAKNIGFVLSLLQPEDALAPPSCAHLRIAMDDALDEPLLIKLPYLLYTLNQALATTDANVLVHCVAGRSRSASVVIAWLMTTQQLSLHDAYQRVLMSRPWIEPNATFLKHLALFEKTLCVPMSASTRSAIDELTPILPRMDFHPSFVHPITSHVKVMTIRLASDVAADGNSDLQYIYPRAIAIATTTTAPSFAMLQITDVAFVTVRDLTDDHARHEGLASRADLLATLRRFYPDMHDTSACIVISFVAC
ncbi:hypothetical protein SPRG_08656 [Saprolegnia parasitica CBS 223.65]|uniref:Tyrosine specific protein phosphatases domain-containing protein n=1 Tax=Saprolegnia parasitica (strain CBS 223.65) TaxID=695850 RepID=A0A067C652_SAPPC|nr:hypothetical protein SPRG_08656 [Saprolegnia parasitica CBS 223.65]KDO26003.1 hypothetical protein SPRG_08656 [Saprolegnia parasitica CBS 223.65]|eukprot:XP_012203290.1 hypothetical protein SPRG_08656 [Saprolegnia parasitica CBS 223.65]